MISFDVTKTDAAGHSSGLTRVGRRLRAELGGSATAVTWGEGDWAATAGGWFLTPELFSEEERPGFGEFLAARKRPCAAIFYDAIPLRFPNITWPKSVARHPGYLKLLAGFDRVLAISQASRDDLLGFWRWQGITAPPPVDILTLGSDFEPGPRTDAGRSLAASGRTKDLAPPSLLCVGILEPRKNQSFLLDVCADLWTEGLRFELNVVGRVNPHFGRPLAARLSALGRKFPGLRFHRAADDATLTRLYGQARASVFPTLAEGCGLPVLESLWRGVPCVCSDLPVLLENAAGGGCLPVAVNDHTAWKSALKKILTDDAFQGSLAAEACSRPLPTWSDAARQILSVCSP
jgi:glycosyltransferase involved in cell wall biosynthesis